MKSIIVAILSFSFLILSGFVPARNVYLHDSDLLSIEFPAEPKKQTQQVDTEIGPLSIDMVMLEQTEGTDGQYLYAVMTSVYPDSLINSDKTEMHEKFFRGSIDGAVNNVQGKILSEKIVSLKGYPGRQIAIDYGSGMAVISMTMYLVHNEMIFLQTISKPGEQENAAAAKFYGSFKLKK